MSRTRIDPSLLNNLSSNLNMGSNKIVSLSNGTVSTDSAAFGQIKVIQIVTSTSTTSTTTSSSSFVNTNLSCNITPTSSSNKVLIMASGNLQCTGIIGTETFLTLARGGSNLLASNGMCSVVQESNTVNITAPATLTYIDSPASTSTLTYTVQIKSTAANGVFGADTTTQSMILMEVAA